VAFVYVVHTCNSSGDCVIHPSSSHLHHKNIINRLPKAAKTSSSTRTKNETQQQLTIQQHSPISVSWVVAKNKTLSSQYYLTILFN